MSTPEKRNDDEAAQQKGIRILWPDGRLPVESQEFIAEELRSYGYTVQRAPSPGEALPREDVFNRVVAWRDQLHPTAGKDGEIALLNEVIKQLSAPTDWSVCSKCGADHWPSWCPERAPSPGGDALRCTCTIINEPGRAGHLTDGKCPVHPPLVGMNAASPGGDAEALDVAHKVLEAAGRAAFQGLRCGICGQVRHTEPHDEWCPNWQAQVLATHVVYAAAALSRETQR